LCYAVTVLKEASFDSPFSDINSVDQDLHFLLGQITSVLAYQLLLLMHLMTIKASKAHWSQDLQKYE